jgi:hypothetical protein
MDASKEKEASADKVEDRHGAGWHGIAPLCFLNLYPLLHGEVKGVRRFFTKECLGTFFCIGWPPFAQGFDVVACVRDLVIRFGLLKRWRRGHLFTAGHHVPGR